MVLHFPNGPTIKDAANKDDMRAIKMGISLAKFALPNLV